MRAGLFQSILTLLICIAPIATSAEDIVIETFEEQPESRWRFFTDGVMGGVSTGNVTFVQEDKQTHANMTGNVSTANNGGFIQIRLDLPDGAVKDAKGVRLIVRGNDQRYFVHLRTNGTVLPWHYFQAGFDVTEVWEEVRLPLNVFERSGRMLRAVPRAGGLTSVAVVAFGRDHRVDIDVREIGFY
ncbi:CIA30 family protein [Aestuariicoccus sp. MJ-SS9]|uniref:CIA30 family protein n=1 Tax=Aestuariicoccus sp. MJ-SS9 TaxID=3079855 RepID=UPI00290FF4EA|nr:CIA30 family protein [Aestuariicoccus sp. MJ-SS9]MDU8913713.1 CIA30 family protein [Aestuariicoccus sp. MJ-SS9]